MANQVEMFDPVVFSVEENEFLAKYAGEAPEVAEMDGFPSGVNPNAVLPTLERIFKLIQLEEKRGQEWIGVEAVKNACSTYVREFKRWREEMKRGGPKYPSKFVWDERGRGHAGAVGADAGKVKSYFDSNGVRKEFAIELVGKGTGTYKPDWIREPIKKVAPKLIEDQEKGIVQCPVCFFTQNFDPEQRSSYNVARGRMARHLTASKKDADKHREVYTEEFGHAEVS